MRDLPQIFDAGYLPHSTTGSSCIADFNDGESQVMIQGASVLRDGELLKECAINSTPLENAPCAVQRLAAVMPLALPECSYRGERHD